MTLIAMFKATDLRINHFVRAKRTVMVKKEKRFVKGRVYRVIDINGMCLESKQSVTLCGENSKPHKLTVGWGEKFASPWTAFDMACH
jgi:hypothetical protein